MLVWIWTRDDETGLLDDEFRDGDIFKTAPDGTPVGGLETKAWLVIQVPNPANLAKVETELVRPEYAPGATPGDDHLVRRKRVFSLDWRNHFTQSEIATIEDGALALPDGTLDSGGTVSAGVVSSKFTIADVRRK